MRKPILLLLSVAVACSDGMAASDAVIPNFRENAVTLMCEAVGLGVEATATEIRRATDSTWTLLDGPQLQLLTFTDDLRLVDRTPLPERGPGAVEHPISAALLGDSAVVVAARGGLRLVFLSRDGHLLHSTPLDFIPNSVTTTRAGHVLVTPLPFGSRPETLLLRHADAGWEALPVPKRVYDDMSINALGNAALVEPLSDGRALVMHQFLRPRAFLVDAAGGVEPRTPPTPDGTGEHLDYVPRPPVTPDQMARTLVPAMAMSVDPGRDEVYLLTRSGHIVDGQPERAILRATDQLDFIEGYTVPVHASAMVYLARRHAALLADDADGFHLCPLPDRDRP